MLKATTLLIATTASAATVNTELIHQGAECLSDDSFLGSDLPDQNACALACQNTAGCVFFIWGINNKAGRKFCNSVRRAASWSGADI